MSSLEGRSERWYWLGGAIGVGRATLRRSSAGGVGVDISPGSGFGGRVAMVVVTSYS